VLRVQKASLDDSTALLPVLLWCEKNGGSVIGHCVNTHNHFGSNNYALSSLCQMTEKETLQAANKNRWRKYLNL
jgi:hypothetical protein